MNFEAGLPGTGIGLQHDALQAVFPFHFVFDRELRLTQLGPALQKLLPDLARDASFADVFSIATPSVPATFDAIDQQSFTVFFIESQDKRFKLKGQMRRTQEHGRPLMLFLGSPVVRDLSSVSGIGLTLKDFAIHDSAVDFLILLQTKTNTINDVKNMADRLKKEVAERREAQKELQRANEVLEARVRERTHELETANGELQTEIGERRRAEERVRVANAQLKGMVRRLEEHNRQMLLLNAMGDMLQACRTVGETHSVIADSLSRLFPGGGGSLSLLDFAAGAYEVVVAWGEEVGHEGERFAREDCWGLRRGRIHEHESGGDESVCAHVRARGEAAGVPYLCVPLASQGEQHGLLHLHDLPAGSGDDEMPDLANDRRQLIHSASEHISLAIANLKLQEHLRQQSIRDALTGLYNRRHMEDSLRREIARADRSGQPCAIVMLDVDHFKRFNDSYGHQAGDALLGGLGKFLQAKVRGEDIPCRYGGEEFILILPGASADGAAKRAEQLRAGVEATLRVAHEGRNLPPVTISLGVAAYPLHAGNVAEAVKAADAALYRAKEGGRNRVAVATGKVA